MALARVVTFDGVDENRIAEMKREMEGSGRPEGVPASEIIILHDPDASKSVAMCAVADHQYRPRSTCSNLPSHTSQRFCS